VRRARASGSTTRGLEARPLAPPAGRVADEAAGADGPAATLRAHRGRLQQRPAGAEGRRLHGVGRGGCAAREGDDQEARQLGPPDQRRSRPAHAHLPRPPGARGRPRASINAGAGPAAAPDQGPG
jgi:hypothetical protein